MLYEVITSNMAEKTVALKTGQNLIGDIDNLNFAGKILHRFGKRITFVGRTEDGPSLGENSFNALGRQPNEIVPVEQTTVRITSYNVCYTKLLRGSPERRH